MISKLVFAIFDSKAACYKNIFFMQSKGEALRMFRDVANDKKTEIGRHPEDYCLFLLGSVDMVSGRFANESVPMSLGLAQEYVDYQRASNQEDYSENN